MAVIDSLLSILGKQRANELRLGTDRSPQMLADGAVQKLRIPATSADELRHLLTGLLTPEQEQTLRANGRIELGYASPHGEFAVKVEGRADGLDATFTLKPERAPTAASASLPAAPPQRSRVSGTDGSAHSTLRGLIEAAVSVRASDLHLLEAAPPMVRVDGRLRRLLDQPTELAAALELDAAHLSQVLAGRAVDLALELSGIGCMRLHVFRTAEGLATAVRLLPRAAPSLASLHLSVPIDDLADLQHGLVLVCGASGAGKSTTLAALAQEALRRRSIVLVTLEDPIEYALEAGDASLSHRKQVGREVPDFASGLREALREDPDVLLVGEMRDPETVSLALTAAETGHLVLSSLHGGSAASAIQRIFDAYPSGREAQTRAQLADSLRAVVVQRLLPRARGPGRVLAVEVVRVTHAVAALIRDGRTAQISNAVQAGRREGMIALERSLSERVLAGDITLEVARTAANDPASLHMYLNDRRERSEHT